MGSVRQQQRRPEARGPAATPVRRPAGPARTAPSPRYGFAPVSPRHGSAPFPRHGFAPSNGLPEPLKSNMEAMSGFAMDDVRVHRNSSRPAALGALAFTQSSEIYLGPGQERHLPHEAWHAVQQKQGRVRATLQMKGVGINADSLLEAEADRMAAASASTGPSAPPRRAAPHAPSVVQRVMRVQGREYGLHEGRDPKRDVRAIQSAVMIELGGRGLQLSVGGQARLLEWCTDRRSVRFSGMQDVVDTLVSENLTVQKSRFKSTGPKTLGKRPTFTGAANQMKYGWAHGDTARRHVISSSTLGVAIEESLADLAVSTSLAAINDFLFRHGQAIGRGSGPAALLTARRAAWVFVHNHVGNLWVGPSPINTAIGFVRSSINQAIRDIGNIGGPVPAAALKKTLETMSGPMGAAAKSEWQDFVRVVVEVIDMETDAAGYVDPVETSEFLTDVTGNADLDIPDTATEDYRAELTDIYLALVATKTTHDNIFAKDGLLDRFMALEVPPEGSAVRTAWKFVVLQSRRHFTARNLAVGAAVLAGGAYMIWG